MVLQLPAVLLASACLGGCSGSADLPRVILGTTHTVEDSGLLGMLTDAFGHDLGGEYRLSAVVAASGEVLMMAGRGDLDVVLAHSPDDEIALVAAGRAESREPVMYNDFIVLGPPTDPAGVRSTSTAAAAFARIQRESQPFVSRADGSGTHRREAALWAAAHTVPDWNGYIQAGTGMADALRLAAQRSAYILSDRATFEMLRSSLALQIVHEGDPGLLNQYSVLVVADAMNRNGARRLALWLRSRDVQERIAAYGRLDTGRAIFFAGSPAAANDLH